jgi:hypothetical protein
MMYKIVKYVGLTYVTIGIISAICLLIRDLIQSQNG